MVQKWNLWFFFNKWILAISTLINMPWAHRVMGKDSGRTNLVFVEKIQFYSINSGKNPTILLSKAMACLNEDRTLFIQGSRHV